MKKELSNEKIITYRFWLRYFPIYFVKKPRRSSATPTFLPDSVFRLFIKKSLCLKINILFFIHYLRIHLQPFDNNELCMHSLILVRFKKSKRLLIKLSAY